MQVPAEVGHAEQFESEQLRTQAPAVRLNPPVQTVHVVEVPLIVHTLQPTGHAVQTKDVESITNWELHCKQIIALVALYVHALQLLIEQVGGGKQDKVSVLKI